MADFKQAFIRLMMIEGNYSNDPNDYGGETFKGISRRFNPNWEGWEIIDNNKRSIQEGTFDNALLNSLVMKYYGDKYWHPLHCAFINNQIIAEELLEVAVNIKGGRHTAVKFLQESLNKLNRDGKLFNDLVVDGLMGQKTIHALDRLNSKDQELCYLMMNVLQAKYYMDNSQEVFIRGLFRRVALKVKL